MSTPKVSICIPSYNNPEEMERLIASCLEQSYTDWEMIITDDSTDELVERKVEELKEKDCRGRICYTHNEKPLGHIFNWNAALKKATGELIKIMFSDDWFTFPDSLEKMVRLMDENPEAGLGYSGTRQVSSVRSYDRRASESYVQELQEDYRNLFLGNQIGAPSAVIYRSCGALFDERSNWASDVFLYFEVLTRNPATVFTEEPLISIGIHEEQYTGTFTEWDQRKYQDYLLLYQKYELEKSPRCKEEMLRLNILYRRGRKQALDCGADEISYWKAWCRDLVFFRLAGLWMGVKHHLGIGNVRKDV